MLHIAPLAVAQVPAAVHVLRRSFVESYVTLAPESKNLIEEYAALEITEKALRQIIHSEQDQAFVLLAGAVVAGVMELTNEAPPADPLPASLRVHRLYLAKAHTGQGHGKSLLAHAESVARNLNRSKLWLSVWDLNTAAIGFYEKQGFKRNGHIPWDYETDDDARHDLDIVFEKSLV